MKVGTIVKFTAPADDAEAVERMVVVDDRGERVLVRWVAGFDDWSIKPEAAYSVSDLCEC